MDRTLQCPLRLMPRRLLDRARGQELREAVGQLSGPPDWGPGGLGVSPWGGPGHLRRWAPLQGLALSPGPGLVGLWVLGLQSTHLGSHLRGHTWATLCLPGRAGPHLRTHEPHVRAGLVQVPPGARGTPTESSQQWALGKARAPSCPPLQASSFPSVTACSLPIQLPAGWAHTRRVPPRPHCALGVPRVLGGTPPPSLHSSSQVRTLSQGTGGGGPPDMRPRGQPVSGWGFRFPCGVAAWPPWEGRALGALGPTLLSPQGLPSASPAPALGSGQCQARAGEGEWARQAWGLPSPHLGGGAGATITGKAKAVVSLLGKYLQKPQEAAGWRAGPSQSPRPGHSGGTGTQPGPQ